ncbi:MAG: hypothetical protein II951_13535 [Bacteroidales bacterium]|nr:hypothetical protein [Bacteroidales bacterium]
MCSVLIAGVTAGVQETHEYVDLGLESGTLWATCNDGRMGSGRREST